MEFSREKPSVKFSIPDRPTVRQQMAYYSAITNAKEGLSYFERLWHGTRVLIADWQCADFDKDVDLESVDNPSILDVMIWASTQVRDHLNKIADIPKNS